MIIQEWRSRKSDILPFALVVVGFALLAVYAGKEDGWYAFVFVLFGAILALNIAHSVIEHNHHYMVIAIPPDVVREVVENLLQEKGLAYHPTAQGFDLTYEELQIKVGQLAAGPKSLLVRGPKAYISIGPVSEAEEPLIESLQAIITEGLLPGGLRR